MCHNAPIGTCLQVYYAIFYSHLQKKLQTSTKMFENYDLFLTLKVIPILYFFKLNLKLLKVCDIIKQQQLKLVYEFYRNLFPTVKNNITIDNDSKNNVPIDDIQNIFLLKGH